MKIIQDKNEVNKLVRFMEMNGMETIYGYGVFDDFKKDKLDKNRVYYIGYIKDENNKKNEVPLNETHFIIEELEKDNEGKYHPTGIFTHYWDYDVEADKYVENLLKTNNIKSQVAYNRYTKSEYYDEDTEYFDDLQKLFEKKYPNSSLYFDSGNDGFLRVYSDTETYNSFNAPFAGPISIVQKQFKGNDGDFDWVYRNKEDVINEVVNEIKQNRKDYLLTSRIHKNICCDKSNVRNLKAECLKRAEFWLTKAENLKS